MSTLYGGQQIVSTTDVRVLDGHVLVGVNDTIAFAVHLGASHLRHHGGLALRMIFITTGSYGPWVVNTPD